MDDCSVNNELMKKKDMFSYLVFSGQHTEQCLWSYTEIQGGVASDLVKD